jgi:hypothetical protein
VTTTCDVILLAAAGYIVSHCWKDLAINVFWINGQHLRKAKARSAILCMTSNGASPLFVCGRDDGVVEIRSLYSLEVLVEKSDLNSFGAVRFF